MKAFARRFAFDPRLSAQVSVDRSVIRGLEFAALLAPIAVDDDGFEAFFYGLSSQYEINSQAVTPMKRSATIVPPGVGPLLGVEFSEEILQTPVAQSL